jgi:hypothetical protein
LASLRERAAETGKRLGAQLDRIMPQPQPQPQPQPRPQHTLPCDDGVALLSPDRGVPSLSVYPMVPELGR